MSEEITKGLYEIRNKDNNNKYIGISNNIERRWNEHKEDLKLNVHHQRELQKEYNKFKEIYQDDTISHYEFNILEQVETFNRNNMQVVEDEYILKNRNINYGYGQKTNYELYKEDKCFIDSNFLINHKELNDTYYETRRKERKQKLKENEKWQN